jgi:hypothetical protein
MVASGTSAVIDLRVLAALAHAEDLAAARVQVADHVAHVGLGRDDLDRHHRLEQVQAARLAPSWNAIEPATSNAGPDESTSW